MNEVHGTYHASNDLKYEYDATWNEHPAGVLWSATVSRERKILAQPDGLIPGVTGDRGELQSLMRKAVQEAIERLARTA